MRTSEPRLLASLVALAAIAWTTMAPARAAEPMPGAKELPPAATRTVDFVADIEPLLKKNCHSCHGAEHQEGGLRLDAKARALAGGDLGKEIIPGKSGESRLIRVVAGGDDEIGAMPPEGKGQPLTAAQIGLLRAWIDQGAQWPDAAAMELVARKHWSFQPVKAFIPPTVADAARLQEPLDAFILAKLEQQKLALSPPVDRATLLRRMYLDLHGLPPTPQAVDDFLADSRPDATERQIDRLLASPAYGERFARHWLDQARYADSDGYEKDKPRPFAWRYREWVIAALSADLSFRDFTIQQLAGDLLPGATLDARIATGLHRNTLHNTEGGIDPEEDRVKKTVDRTNTLGAVWLGLTLGCAQCHTHKYDPITNREYYSLYAFFNSIQETDIEAPLPADLAQLEQSRVAHAAKQQLLKDALTAYEKNNLADAQAQWEAQQNSPARWDPLSISKATSKLGATLTSQSDGSLLAAGKNVISDVYTLETSWSGQPLTAIRLEVLPDASLPSQGPGRSKNGNFVLAKIRLLAHPKDGAEQEIAFTAARSDFAQKSFSADLAFNENPADGWAIAPEFGKRHVAVFELKEPLAIAAGTKLTVILDQHYGQKDPHNLGRWRLSATSSPTPVPLEGIPTAVAEALAKAPQERSPVQVAAVVNYFKSVDPEHVRLRDELAKHQAAAPRLPDDRKAQAVAEMSPPRSTRVLVRGDFLNPGDEVQRETLSVLPGLPPEGNRSRLELAQWVVSDSNPLTPRVTVNRAWMQLFGRGIVPTVDDFGKQGEKPSHPELLDRLAADFVRRGWSLKQLHRRIVASAAYQQSSSLRDDLHEIDPENALFARQTRRRVEAEIIRDLSLAASGLLAGRIGGPSVRPPQPGEYSSLTYANAAKWVDSQGADRYRRGLYTFFQRTSPYPMLAAFDAPDSTECAVKRQTSNTPLQALTLWNDPVFVEAAQTLARRVVTEVPTEHAGHASPEQTVRARANWAFRLCLARSPSQAELGDVTALFNTQLQLAAQAPAAARPLLGADEPPAGVSIAELAAWVNVGRTLLNLDEFVTRE